jgi:hypothetical protein
MKKLSPADRVVACFVALLSVLMLGGVRYIFRHPTQTDIRMAPTAHPYMP